MIESPLSELKAEWTREGVRAGVREGELEALVAGLVARFGAKAESVRSRASRPSVTRHA